MLINISDALYMQLAEMVGEESVEGFVEEVLYTVEFLDVATIPEGVLFG